VSKKVPNFVGRVDKSLIANGVLRFQRGHKVLDDLQKFLGTNYNPYDWASNGPHAVTYAVKRQNNKTSDKVLVYPEEKFFPIPYQAYGKIFNVNDKKEVLDKTKGSYGIHLWNAMNKFARNISCDFKKDSAFKILALKNCPLTAMNF